MKGSGKWVSVFLNLLSQPPLTPLPLGYLLTLSSPLSDNRPPGVVPAKANYMGKDLRRLATYYQIPLQTPSVSVT